MRKCDVYGVSRDNGRGIPSEILMDNPTKTKERNVLVGATKAAV